MYRRQFNQSLVGTVALLVLAAHQQAHALSLSDLTDQDASQGLKAVLEKGAPAALGLLGQPDGFMGNPKVRIALPGFLEDAAKLLKMTAQGKRVDGLVTSMNRAAEAAILMGKDLLLGAVKNMSVTDAKNILRGGDNSVTQFLANKTRQPLGEKFLPVVTQATAPVRLADKYNRVAGKITNMDWLKSEDANIQQHVTAKSLHRLYTLIGEEERKIRQDPVGAGNAILQKVFGALK